LKELRKWFTEDWAFKDFFSLMLCDERSESRKGLGRWIRNVAVVTEEAGFVLKYERVQFSLLAMA